MRRTCRIFEFDAGDAEVITRSVMSTLTSEEFASVMRDGDTLGSMSNQAPRSAAFTRSVKATLCTPHAPRAEYTYRDVRSSAKAVEPPGQARWREEIGEDCARNWSQTPPISGEISYTLAISATTLLCDPQINCWLR